jgi:hypothetical protein
VNTAQLGTATRDELLTVLVTESDLLVANLISLAGANADRERRYWHSYNSCDSSQSVSARDKVATSETLADRLLVADIRRDIEVGRVKVALIRDLLA